MESSRDKEVYVGFSFKSFVPSQIPVFANLLGNKFDSDS